MFPFIQNSTTGIIYDDRNQKTNFLRRCAGGGVLGGWHVRLQNGMTNISGAVGIRYVLFVVAGMHICQNAPNFTL